MGEVLRLSAGTVTLQDAVDAFLEHHDLAPATRRVYRASLAGLAAAFDPATALDGLSGPALAGWFRARHAGAAPATWNRELASKQAGNHLATQSCSFDVTVDDLFRIFGDVEVFFPPGG